MRKGFTLIELIVVIAICATVVLLLLGSIQEVCSQDIECAKSMNIKPDCSGDKFSTECLKQK